MITSAIERQNRVVDELHQRKVAVVPPKLSLLSSNDVAGETFKLVFSTFSDHRNPSN
jgi:hypothetical protein